MKNTPKKIILIFVMILLVNTLTGCAAMALVVLAPVVQGAVEVGAGIAGAIHDAVENERYYKAAQTVVEHDDEDSF
jgi:hypothetical protein